MVSVEEGGFNVLTIFTARLDQADINATSMLLQLWIVAWTAYVGLLIAAQTAIAARLGAGRPGAARALARAVVRAGCVAQVALLAILVAARPFIFRLWTDDAATLAVARDGLPPVAAAMALSSLSYTLIFILNGAARPDAGAWAMSAGTWAVMVPLAYALCFRLRMGVGGIWWALLVSEAVKLSALAWIYAGVDWAERARAAVERQRG
jgi:Na+-driven multidrug efflux pump